MKKTSMVFLRLRPKIVFALIAINIFVTLNHNNINNYYLNVQLKLILNHTSTQSNDVVKTAERIQKPFIFIGGFPRSGTTLMRAILDVHEQVIKKPISCGPETRILPLFLDLITSAMSNATLLNDMNERYITNATLNDAAALFIQYIIENRLLKKAERQCAKDPRTLIHIKYLHQLFPSAKFVYMVRDARAAVYSYMCKEFPLAKNSFLLKTMWQEKIQEFLLDWEATNKRMNDECKEVGERFCSLVKYEELVQQPEVVLRNLMHFFNLTWTSKLLRHEMFIGKQVMTSELEWSNRDIERKISNSSIHLWTGNINYDDDLIANLPMFKLFGYIPS